MRVRRPLSYPVAICIASIAFACSKEIQREPRQYLTDGKYDSEFPAAPTSGSLSDISESIFMVNCIGSYRTFTFEESKKIAATDITSQLLNQIAPSTRFSDNSIRGTATVIFNDGHKMAFLTCAHNVTMPDTVISFYRDPDRRPTKYIRSIAIKIKQFNFVSPLPEDGSVDIVAYDASTDIAVVGKKVSSQFALGIPTFRYRLGRAGELNWGTFTYVLSCPAGVKMVTPALASLSTRDPEESFFIDAVLGTGSSGGIVLAIRDGVPNFELVGLVRVVQARFSNLLVPKDSGEEVYDSAVPYAGEVYVTKKVDLEYGVTKCISAEAIRMSLERNMKHLIDEGYDLTRFAGLQK